MPSHTILITGGMGYVGSHVGYLLAQQGHTVIIIDDMRQGHIGSPRWGTLYTGNCGDRETLETIFSHHPIELVIHCAASIDVAQSVRQPLQYYQNNVASTITLLSAMEVYGISKLIFSSSCAVYGAPIIVPMPEDHPKHPISPYGQSKLMCEQIITDTIAATGLHAVIFRYFNVAGAMPEYGLGEWHMPEIHLIPRLIASALEQKPFTIFGTNYPTPDGTCLRDFVHVWDIAHAHAQAMVHLDAGQSGAFNIGSGHGYSIRHMIELIETQLSCSIKVIEGPTRPGDPSSLVSDSRAAQMALDWQAHYSSPALIIQSALQSFLGPQLPGSIRLDNSAQKP